MDGGLITAIAAAAVSGVAAGISFWQARIASAAADAANRQATAAEETTKAAQDQVELLRLQLAAEDADRREARGPQFIVTEGWVDRVTDNNVVSAVVTLKQVSGPGLETVTAAATGPVVHEAYTTTAKFGPLAAGGSETITFHLDWDAPVEGLFVLDLDCATAAGERWRRHVSHDLVRKPEPPTEWEKRRNRAQG